MADSKILAAIFIMAMVQLADLSTPAMACLYCPPETKSPPYVAPPALTPPAVTPPAITPPAATPPAVAPPPASSSNTCPLDTLKLGVCLELLGGVVSVKVGDPVVNECCPVLQGVLALEAALCLCTTIKLSALNLNIILPLALELLVTCGQNPPSGFTCPKSS